MATPDIKVGSKFDGKGFKQAETALGKLQKSTLSLAKSFGLAFSAERIARFGVSAVKAFAAEEKQIASLTATVKALGLGFQAADLNNYIEDLERLTGIAREQLQPALQKLISQTGSVTKAQEILSTSVKVSMSGLMSTEEAAQALTQAYVGNVKGLKNFNLGLTNAELAAMKFNDILLKINDTYKNQLDEALTTTQVKLDKIKVAADNAKESIGGGLVKAFSDLAGNGDLNKANSLLERMGELLGRIIGNAFNPVKLGGFYLPIPNLLAKEPQKNTIGSPAEWRKRNAAITKAETEAAKKLLKIEQDKAAALAKQVAQKRLQALIDKANAKLGKVTDIFDIEKIQIAAALTNQAEMLGKATTTSQALQIANDTARLNVKNSILEVEKAIASKDEDAINAALKKLDSDMKILGVLNSQKVTIGEIGKLLDTLTAKDIKGSITYSDNISDALKKIESLYATQITLENKLQALKIANLNQISSLENDTLDRKLRGYSSSALALASLAAAERQAAIAKLASDIGTASLIQGLTNGLSLADAAAGARYAAQGAYNYYIQITTGIGDPNAIAAAVNDVITQAYNRGTLTVLPT